MNTLSPPYLALHPFLNMAVQHKSVVMLLCSVNKIIHITRLADGYGSNEKIGVT